MSADNTVSFMVSFNMAPNGNNAIMTILAKDGDKLISVNTIVGDEAKMLYCQLLNGKSE